MCKSQEDWLKRHGDQWPGPRSDKLSYDITSTTSLQDTLAEKSPPDAYTNRLGPVAAGAWAIVRHMRVIVGGHIVEDFDYYNRLRQMLDLLTRSERRTHTMVEGIGGFTTTNGNYGIYKGATKAVAFKPMSGLFNQTTDLPIRYCPVILELERADASDTLYGGAEFNSKDYVINKEQLKAGLITLDNALDNESAARLMQGEIYIPMPFSTYTTSSQVSTNLEVDINMQRSFSRLKGVCITLYKDTKSFDSGADYL